MKTYKEFITKKEPVELDEAIPLALGGIALSKWLLGGGLAATASIAYANRNRISQTFSNMFNRKETIDDLDKLNNFWRDTKTNNDTNIADPIGKDVINPGALDTKTDTTDTKINFFYVGRIEDVGAYTNTADAPFRFLPCLVSGLAYYTAQEVAPERSQELERRYEAELQRALTEDSQSTSVNIVPQNFYPSG